MASADQAALKPMTLQILTVLIVDFLFFCLQELGIYTCCLFFFALVNSCGLRVLTVCTQIGGIFHLVGITLLIFMVPMMATQHQPSSWVFGHFEKAQAMDVGIINPL